MELIYIIAASILLLIWVLLVWNYYRIEMKSRQEYASRKALRLSELHKLECSQGYDQMYVSVRDFLAYLPDGTLSSSRQWARIVANYCFALLVAVTLLVAWREQIPSNEKAQLRAGPKSE